MHQKSYPYQNLSLEDMNGEIWKDIYGYEGAYQISNKSRVKSLARLIYHKKGIHEIKEDRILKQRISKVGKFCSLTLSLKNEFHSLKYSAARLVYDAYIRPLRTFKEKILIVHQDNNPLNNDANNLIALTHREFNDIKRKEGKLIPPDVTQLPEKIKIRRLEKLGTPVSQYDKTGKYIRSYYSMSEACRVNGLYHSCLCHLVDKNKFSPNGYAWRKGKSTDDIDTSSFPEIKVIQPVSQYDRQGRYIATYPSVARAAEALAMSRKNIRNCLHGHQITAGGYIWRYGNSKKITLPKDRATAH